MKREDKQVEGMINVFSLIFEGLGKWFWIFPFLPFFFLLTGLGGKGDGEEDVDKQNEKRKIELDKAEEMLTYEPPGSGSSSLSTYYY